MPRRLRLREFSDQEFSSAAEQGNAGAVDFRDDLAAKMTPDQIAEAQRLASEWKRK